MIKEIIGKINDTTKKESPEQQGGESPDPKDPKKPEAKEAAPAGEAPKKKEDAQSAAEKIHGELLSSETVEIDPSAPMTPDQVIQQMGLEIEEGLPENAGSAMLEESAAAAQPMGMDLGQGAGGALSKELDYEIKKTQKVTNLIMDQIKELIEIDNNFNTKIGEMETKLNSVVANSEKLQKTVEGYNEKFDLMEKSMEKFMGLYEVISNQYNPFLTKNDEDPNGPAGNTGTSAQPPSGGPGQAPPAQPPQGAPPQQQAPSQGGQQTPPPGPQQQGMPPGQPQQNNQQWQQPQQQWQQPPQGGQQMPPPGPQQQGMPPGQPQQNNQQWQQPQQQWQQPSQGGQQMPPPGPQQQGMPPGQPQQNNQQWQQPQQQWQQPTQGGQQMPPQGPQGQPQQNQQWQQPQQQWQQPQQGGQTNGNNTQNNQQQ